MIIYIIIGYIDYLFTQKTYYPGFLGSTLLKKTFWNGTAPEKVDQLASLVLLAALKYNL